LNIISSASLLKNSLKEFATESSKSKMSSNQAADLLLKKLKDVVNDPESSAQFTMGILSNWLDGMENIYEKVKKNKAFFSPCYPEIKNAMEKSNQTVDEKNKNDFKFKENAMKDSTSGDKVKICENTKKLIQEVFLKAVDNIYAGKAANDKAAFIKSSNNLNPKDFCNYALNEKAKDAFKLIKDKFENKKTFLEICMQFRAKDCSKFTFETLGAWKFIGNTYFYSNFVKKASNCINNNLIKGGKEENSGKKEIIIILNY
jgi:hypothetical protein